jgi:hypothetical protein
LGDRAKTPIAKAMPKAKTGTAGGKVVRTSTDCIDLGSSTGTGNSDQGRAECATPGPDRECPRRSDAAAASPDCQTVYNDRAENINDRAEHS